MNNNIEFRKPFATSFKAALGYLFAKLLFTIVVFLVIFFVITLINKDVGLGILKMIG